MRRTRILHTADWHLGHQLLGHARDHEHAAFLSWLIETVVHEEVDAVIVAGDVFDGRSPSGAAQAAYFGFLASLRARAPGTEVLIIAGNHDSPSRLAAAGPVLGMMGVHVVGAASPGASPADLVRVLRTRAGHPLAVAAIPFVRPSDLLGVGDGLDPGAIATALGALYRDVVAEAQALSDGPVVATGHAHLRGALLSPRSERPVYGGDAGAIDRAIFPSGCSYVALGHLHLSQDVSAPGSGPMARYAGSPIPLALAEASYQHAVTLVDLEEHQIVRCVERRVPRTVAIERIEAPSVDDALAAIERLPRASELPRERHPWVEVRAPLAAGTAAGSARARIEAALGERAGRLVRLALEEPETIVATSDEADASEVADVHALLRQRWREVRGADLGADHERALGTAIQAAMQALEDERRADEEVRASAGALS